MPAGKPAAGHRRTVVEHACRPVPVRRHRRGITSTKPISGTAGTGKGLPTTGAGEDLFLLLLAAICLMVVMFAARRLRTIAALVSFMMFGVNRRIFVG